MQKQLTILAVILALFTIACGSAEKNDDLSKKKAKLEDLKAQQAKLTDQITALQAEIIKADPSANPEKAKLVSVQKVSAEDFKHYIDLQGTVESQNIAYVTPRGQAGQVKAVYVQQGDYVKKGQVLLKLDDALLKTQLDDAETQLKYAQDIYNRRNNLWKQNIGTEVELKTAKNTVDQAQARIDQLKEQMSYSNVTAEMSGVADEVTIRVGETFTGNPASGGYIKLVNTGDLKVTAQVPDNYLGKVKEGGMLKVVFPDLNDSLTTPISVAGKVINPATRTFTIEGKLPGNKNLKPNQLAYVRILDYSANNTFTVPVNTLETDEKGKFVLVAESENGKMIARKKHVEIGELYNDRIEIKSGLNAGDVLITDGYQNLYDGQLITTSAS